MPKFTVYLFMGNIVSFYYVSLMKTFVLRILLALCRLTEDVCVENMFSFVSTY